MQQPPNFLFLFPDQLRWDWLGVEGQVPVRTPHIDRLAARGIRFTQCRTNSPLCAPARACLATGSRYEHCGVPDNEDDLKPGRPTFFAALRDMGYQTAVCGKCDLHKKSKDFAPDGWTPRLASYGFSDGIDQAGKWDAHSRAMANLPEPYTGFLRQEGRLEAWLADMDSRRHGRSAAPNVLSREHYTDDFCGRAGVTLLERMPEHQPWFLWVNFPGPHAPFDPPAELRSRYDDVAFPPPIQPDPNDRSDHQQLRRNYAAMIEGIDDWCGRLLEAVTARGELENTVVVFSADHGELLGDHGRWSKIQPWEGSVHVPLILAGPGIAPGRTSNALVELIDVGATLLALAGAPPIPAADALSFAAILHGDANDKSHRTQQVSELHWPRDKGWRMTFDGRYKRVTYDDGHSALYDLRDDPDETRDIAERQPAA